MTYSSNPGQYLCLDLETTGLDPNKCGIVECAFTVLDGYFEQTRPVYSMLVLPHEGFVTEEGAAALHQKNGLVDELRAVLEGRRPALRYEQLDAALGVAISRISKPVLLGNTPAFDRSFIAAHLPKTAARLHYATFDVSTLRRATESALELTGNLKALLGFGSHRAADDVAKCVEELQLYFTGIRHAVKSPKTDPQKLARLQWLGVP